MSLYQRYLDYLNQAMPDISNIFRSTPAQAVEETTEETVAQPVGITPQLLQLTGGSGGDGFSVYNPDPTRTRTLKDYRFPFKFTGEDLPEAGDYISGPTGIRSLLSKLPGQGILKGIREMIPPNRRAILENQALGAGIALDDIGRVVAGPGSINTAENIMAGYNLNKVTRETLAKRRRVIEENMKDPVQKAAKLKALDDFEKTMFGDSGIYDDAESIYYNQLDTSTGITKPGTFEDFLTFKKFTEPKRTGIETIPDKEPDPIVDTNAVEAAIAGAGGDTAAQRRQRIQDQRTIRDAYERFSRGDDSAYSSGAAGIQRDSGGREVGYNDPFDPGGGE